jgi:hypothetical protein
VELLETMFCACGPWQHWSRKKINFDQCEPFTHVCARYEVYLHSAASGNKVRFSRKWEVCRGPSEEPARRDHDNDELVQRTGNRRNHA